MLLELKYFFVENLTYSGVTIGWHSGQNAAGSRTEGGPVREGRDRC